MDPDLATATTKQIPSELASAQATVDKWDRGHQTIERLTANEVALAPDHAGSIAKVLERAEREPRVRVYRTLGLQLQLDVVTSPMRLDARLLLCGGGGGVWFQAARQAIPVGQAGAVRTQPPVVVAAAALRRLAVQPRQHSYPNEERKATMAEDLDEFINRCHAALTQQSHGNPQPLLDLWSHSDDVTVMAAAGGYQVGFEAVGKLLTWASSAQKFEGWSAENLVKLAGPEFGMTVELEHYALLVDGEDKGMTLRATQVYRRENDEWRIIHRHGDILTDIEVKW
jgi:ketosteroid isomerase-like protein